VAAREEAASGGGGARGAGDGACSGGLAAVVRVGAGRGGSAGVAGGPAGGAGGGRGGRGHNDEERRRVWPSAGSGGIDGGERRWGAAAASE
jgi:hypothetical protein